MLLQVGSPHPPPLLRRPSGGACCHGSDRSHTTSTAEPPLSPLVPPPPITPPPPPRPFSCFEGAESDRVDYREPAACLRLLEDGKQLPTNAYDMMVRKNPPHQQAAPRSVVAAFTAYYSIEAQV